MKVNIILPCNSVAVMMNCVESIRAFYITNEEIILRILQLAVALKLTKKQSKSTKTYFEDKLM